MLLFGLVVLVTLLGLGVHVALLHRRHYSPDAPLAVHLRSSPNSSAATHSPLSAPPPRAAAIPEITGSCSNSSPHRLLGRQVHVLAFLDRPEDSNRHGFFCDFVRSFTSHSPSVPLTVLGWMPGLRQLPHRHTREFFLGSKVTVLLAYLKGMLRQGDAREEDLVLFSDATDVVWQRPVEDIFGLFLSDHRCDILLGVEKDCWPPSFVSLYPPAPASAVYRHINSGSFIGRLSALVRFLEAATLDLPRYKQHELFYDASGKYVNHPPPQRYRQSTSLAPPVYRRNDQIVFSMLYFEGSHNVSLDFGAQLFQSYQLSKADLAAELFWDGHKQRVTHRPNTVPVALHFNGPSKIHYTPELRSRLKTTWLPDNQVARSHFVCLVNRARYPSPFDIAGVDYQADSLSFESFDFPQTCSDQ